MLRSCAFNESNLIMPSKRTHTLVASLNMSDTFAKFHNSLVQFVGANVPSGPLRAGHIVYVRVERSSTDRQVAQDE